MLPTIVAYPDELIVWDAEVDRSDRATTAPLELAEPLVGDEE